MRIASTTKVLARRMLKSTTESCGAAPHQVEVVGDALDLRAIHDVQDSDRLLEGQVGQQLGGEQEALGCAWLAGCLDQQTEDLALVHAVHALIDLIHHSERRHSHILHHNLAR